MAAVIVAFEIRRRGFAAEVAVDALVIDIELSLYVLRIFIGNIGHIILLAESEGNGRMNQWRRKWVFETPARARDPTHARLARHPHKLGTLAASPTICSWNRRE
jgi:hypothetical protein